MNKRKIKIIIKRVAVCLAVALLSIVVVLIFANWKIPHDTKEWLYNDVDSIPPQKVALVLGASKYIRGGLPNPYFDNRIAAAHELYVANKVKAFVLSGDNGYEGYSEPEDMRDALVALGVPDSIIYLDHAGFRTLDSVVRINEIFGQDSFIVVSQKFHNERAVFLAQYYGYTAYGYNAKDVALGRVSYKTIVREKFARVKVFVDIILNKQPKFLGEPIEIK
ncbi:vancomycin high temperature exclusion protein [Dysgonomonas sp. HGC4]|uniref:SanA/YdcF family protein n=1 Tax=Dysgonomonas sp. HGC4 TaxID=1658009 RepID=UPI000680A59E|nr:ElyC/SanA/YdcF family protein [Dysgonomonas sp. HGC4]MBD8349782.1 YdcF family protein [Dysgonomonas sp. HGC4]